MKIETSLLPHQEAAVGKLGRLKVGALFMEQGTGKTRTALELISRRMDRGKVNAVLWLCPCSVKKNLREDIIYHCGGMPDRIVIKGIESISSSSRLYMKLIDLVHRYKVFLIVDESSLCKNPFAIRSSRIVELSRHCTYKLIVFDITDGGGILYVLFNSPSEDEIRQFKEDIEVRYVKVGSVFMMLFKFGSLNWVDAPYSPHLSKISGIAAPADGEGIALQIIFGDARTGMVHGLRLIGLSTEFSRKLAADIAEDLGRPFNTQMYGLDLASVFNKYPTDKLVSMAETSCRIRRIDNV